MSNPSLINYIQQNRLNNIPDDQTYNSLLSADWNKELIEQAFSEMSSPQIPAPTSNFPPSPAAFPQVNPSQQNERPKKTKTIIELCILGVLLLVIVGGISATLFFKSAVNEGPKVEKVLSSFFELAANNNIDGAYNLTSAKYQAITNKKQFEEIVKSAKAVFSPFTSLKQLSFKMNSKAGGSTTYNYTGEITYTDGGKGSLKATLEKEGPEWKITDFDVNVDIDRFNRLQKQNP